MYHVNHKVAFRASSILCTWLLLPTLAFGQRGGSMGGSRDADFGFANQASSGPSLAGKDLEKLSPIAFFAEKKKDLKLSEPQLLAMRESDSALRSANASRYKAVDSLRKAMKPGTSTEDIARAAIARDAMMGVVQEIRGSYDAAAKDAVATLDAAQQATAQELLVKYGEEFQQTMRSKLGARGGAAGPAGRGRGGRGS